LTDLRALKLTLYFNETLRSGHELAADRLLALFDRAGVRTSVLLRGIEGFGAHHLLHADRFENTGLNQPVVVVAVDLAERIESLMPEVDALLRSGLVTAERASLVDDLTGGFAPPEVGDGAVRLTVYCGRGERFRGLPAHRAIVDAMRTSGMDGATVFLGVDGTVHGRRERARLLSRNRDVPLMIVAVGSRRSALDALPAVGRLVGRPTVTVEGIQVCKRDGLLLAEPAPPRNGGDGAGMWRKLMVHAPGDTHVSGETLHYRLVEELRRTEAAGATSLRGIWGFRGAAAAGGDSVRSLRRASPVVTIAIDREPAMRATWELIDGLTRGAGLVTSEFVPAHRILAADAVGSAL